MDYGGPHNVHDPFGRRISSDQTKYFDNKNYRKKRIQQRLMVLLRDSGWRALRVFFIVGGIRSGLNLILKALAYFNRRKAFRWNLRDALIGREVMGASLFFGGFVLTWKFLSRALPIYYGKRTWVTDFFSGLAAGTFILAEREDRRSAYSQQLSVRAAKSFFTSLSLNNVFTFPHANSILFVLSTAQILYSYVLHHNTLVPSIYNFMVRHAQIPHSILEINRRVVRKERIEVESFTELIAGMGATPRNFNLLSKLSGFPKALPCAAYHPNLDSCMFTFVSRFVEVVKMTLPVHAGLTFLPAIFLRFPSFRTDPKKILVKCVLGTFRSSAFLATLVSVYQVTICNFRHIGSQFGIKDHKFLYYLAGLIASTPAILIEKPSRRTELSLYVVPKAVDSFYKILYAKSWIFSIPNFETLMFMVASGVTMAYYQREPETLSPLLKWVLEMMIGKHKPKGSLPSVSEA